MPSFCRGVETSTALNTIDHALLNTLLDCPAERTSIALWGRKRKPEKNRHLLAKIIRATPTFRKATPPVYKPKLRLAGPQPGYLDTQTMFCYVRAIELTAIVTGLLRERESIECGSLNGLTSIHCRRYVFIHVCGRRYSE
jgi:hypothetical protein